MRLQQALDVRNRLYALDSDNLDYQSNLSVTLARLGDALKSKGDTDGALARYNEVLELRRRIADNDPTNLGIQSTLSFAYIYVGDALMAKQDFAGALEAYGSARDIRYELAVKNPQNDGWQLNFATSLVNKGKALVGLGRLADGIGQFQAARKLLEQSVAETKSPARAHVLFDALSDGAAAQAAQGDHAAAAEDYKRALALAQIIAEANPHSSDWRNTVLLAQEHLAALTAPVLTGIGAKP